MHRPEAQAMTGFGGFEQDLEVAVRPLPQRALAARTAARVEHLAQLHDEALPFIIRETAIEIDRARHADRQTENSARGGRHPDVERLRGLRDRVGGDADLTADR